MLVLCVDPSLTNPTKKLKKEIQENSNHVDHAQHILSC